MKKDDLAALNEKGVTRTGMCRFCQQVNVFTWFSGLEPAPEECSEEATKNCDCEGAKFYQQRIYKLNAAKERIDNMLQSPEEEVAKNILMEAAIEIIDETIYSISINIGNGVKVDMKHGKENSVKIKRQEVETREETV